MQPSDDSDNEFDSSCPCGADEKLKAYTEFIQRLAHTLGVAKSIDKSKKTAYLRGVGRFDVIEQARSILLKYGDYEGDFKH